MLNVFKQCQRLTTLRVVSQHLKHITYKVGESTYPALPPSTESTASSNLILNIKTANSSYELFEIISLKRKEFTDEHIIQSLRTLFNLQKNENTSIPAQHILQNVDFESLCRNLKISARTMQLNDVIDALKILAFIGVQADSVICLNLLHTIRHQINDISLGHIIFLEYLLNKMEPTPLAEAFKIALPMLLQIQIGTKMDHENVAQLVELMTFVARNRVSDQCIMNVVSALTMHGDNMTAIQAKSIVHSLTALHTISVNHERLLANCLHVLTQSIDELSYKDVDTTLERLIDKYQSQYAAFYSESFYMQCVQFCLRHSVSFMDAIYIQRKLNKISFVSTPLLDYMTERINQRPDLLISARPTVLFTYVTAIATANYEPAKWSAIQQYIQKNDMLRMERNDLPWIKFALELFSLNVHDRQMLDQIFSTEFLNTHLQRTNNTLDYLQLLLLHQSVQTLWPEYDGNRLQEQFIIKAMAITYAKQECPLQVYVEHAFGGAHTVRSKLKTRQGHFIDHMVVLNGNGEAVPWSSLSEDNEFAEDIETGADEKKLAIVSLPKTQYAVNVPILKGIFHLRVKTLEALRIPVAVINIESWNNLADHEKIPYIQREVTYQHSQL